MISLLRPSLGKTLRSFIETKIEGVSHPFNRKRYFYYAILLYTFILLSANFAGYHSLQIFHFSYPAGTLLIQFAFCCTICFTEKIGFKRTARLIWCATFANLIVALFAYYILALPISEFWVSRDIDDFEKWNQFGVLLMLSAGYICTSLTLVQVAAMLRLWLGSGWLFLRILLILLAVLFVDMLVLMPVLFYIEPDRYMACWKMFSLATIKISLSLVTLPTCYFMVQVLKRRSWGW